MSAFNYDAEAELFPSKSRSSRRKPVGYRRFSSAADAIRFAIEDLPEASLAGAWLEVEEVRFGAQEIRQLYEHADYPLQRREAADPSTGKQEASSPERSKARMPSNDNEPTQET